MSSSIGNNMLGACGACWIIVFECEVAEKLQVLRARFWLAYCKNFVYKERNSFYEPRCHGTAARPENPSVRYRTVVRRERTNVGPRLCTYPGGGSGTFSRIFTNKKPELLITPIRYRKFLI